MTIRNGADEQLLTMTEAAEHLRVHYQTIRRWVKDGTLPTTHVGRTRRIRRRDIDRLWDERGNADAIPAEGATNS